MPAQDVALTIHPDEGPIAQARYLTDVYALDYSYEATEEWETEEDVRLALFQPGDTVSKGRSTSTLYLVRHDARAYVHAGHGSVTVRAAGATDAALAALMAEARDALPVTITGDEKRVPVRFWSLGQNGPQSRTRRVEVPSWADVHGHYPEEPTNQGLRRLMRGFEPSVGGQLILWHGDPGTGKTYALRALAYEWRDWADLHYVTDPEVFFGDRAAYMMDVLLDDDDPPVGVPEEVGGDPRARDGRWKVLVLEDTGELMSADARERSGQGLSRLLNVVDGLIGQGLRVLVVVTTNEKLQRLHPAASRPGRCACVLDFASFSQAEAARWLVERGARDPERESLGPLRARGTWPLAELFALAAGTPSNGHHEPAVGFAR